MSLELKSQINKAEQEKDVKTLEIIAASPDIEVSKLAKLALGRLDDLFYDAETTPDHQQEKLGKDNVEELTKEVDAEINSLKEETKLEIEKAAENTIENNFTQIDLKSPEYSALLETAPVYEKFSVIQARPAVEGEEIVTILNGFEETKNKAEAGDFVAKNPGGEEYIIKGGKFSKLYQPLEDGSYKAVGQVKGIQTDKDVEFTAPWGETMKIKAGGWLVDNNGDRYGIEAKAFQDTYRLMETK